MTSERPAPRIIQPDCRNRARGVWLVKVPKYLSQSWKDQAGAPEVGRLRISKNAINCEEIIFSSTEEINKQQQSLKRPISSLINHPIKNMNKISNDNDTVQEPLPKQHKFRMSKLNNQNLIVTSEDVLSRDDIEDDKIPSVNIEGRVVHRAECTPSLECKDYHNLKRKQLDAIIRPASQAQTIEKAEIKFKPVARHAEHIAAEKAKKDNKNVRLDRDVVQDLLFQAFEKHQYYKLLDLARVTAQPPNYVKEILQEIAIYNTMPPHKYTWELKAQYRHYKEEPDTSSQT